MASVKKEKTKMELIEELENKVEDLKQKITELREECKPEPKLVATDAVFKDGHREKIVYCEKFDGGYQFATESGCYATYEVNNEIADALYRGRRRCIPHINFVRISASMRSYWLDVVEFNEHVVDIDRIEFKLEE